MKRGSQARAKKVLKRAAPTKKSTTKTKPVAKAKSETKAKAESKKPKGRPITDLRLPSRRVPEIRGEAVDPPKYVADLTSKRISTSRRSSQITLSYTLTSTNRLVATTVRIGRAGTPPTNYVEVPGWEAENFVPATSIGIPPTTIDFPQFIGRTVVIEITAECEDGTFEPSEYVTSYSTSLMDELSQITMKPELTMDTGTPQLSVGYVALRHTGLGDITRIEAELAPIDPVSGEPGEYVPVPEWSSADPTPSPMRFRDRAAHPIDPRRSYSIRMRVGLVGVDRPEVYDFRVLQAEQEDDDRRDGEMEA